MENEKETKTLEEKEEKVEEPKKKNFTGIIVVVILVLMIICLVLGYCISESGVIGKKETSKEKQTTEEKTKKETTEEKEEPTNEKTVTNYDVEDEKVSHLISHLLSIGMSRSCGAIEKYATDQKVLATDLDMLTIYHVVEGAEFFNKKDSYTLDEMNAAIKKYFYGDIHFDPTAIDYNGGTCPQHRYDASTKTFIKQETACGSTCGPSSIYKLVKAVDTDGTLVLDVKVAFETDENYYRDYQRTNLIDVASLSNGSTTYDPTLKDRIAAQGGDYKFTFKLVDGNYAFVSSEPVK